MLRLSPLLKGFIWGLGAIALMTLCFVLEIHRAASPSPGLLRSLAEIGVGLLIAYSVTIAASEESLRGSRDHEGWLGTGVAIGVGGLLGIAIALGIAEHRAAGHAGWLDDFGLAWVLSSLGVLGLLVALLPLATYSWSKQGDSSS